MRPLITPPVHLLGNLPRSSGILQLAPVSAARDSGFITDEGSSSPPSSGEAIRQSASFVREPLSEQLLRLQEGLERIVPGTETAHAGLIAARAPIYLEMTLLMRVCYAGPLVTEAGDRAELAALIRVWRKRFDERVLEASGPDRSKNLALAWMITERYLVGSKNLSPSLLTRFRPSQYDMIRLSFGLPHYSRHAAPLLETIGACFEGALYLEQALEALETPPHHIGGSSSQPPSSSNF